MTPGSRITLISLAGAAIGMLALSFAAEPLYSTFCRVTGFGGTTQIAEAPPSGVLDRPVRIRFDANAATDLPVDFRPTEAFVDAKLGETVLSFYEVTNTSDAPIRAVAAYNVAPYKAGKYFNKVECFCFKEKTLQPGRTEKLPVIFFVSPELDQDRYANDVHTVTLSYTYYPVGGIPDSARPQDASAGS